MQSHVAQFLAVVARANGGFTYRVHDGMFPKTGFAVALAKAYERTGPGDLQDHHVADYYADHVRTLDAAREVYGNVCLGAWHYDGQWYLDISVVCDSLAQALAWGRENNQIAVYDLATGESIACAEVAA